MHPSPPRPLGPVTVRRRSAAQDALTRKPRSARGASPARDPANPQSAYRESETAFGSFFRSSFWYDLITALFHSLNLYHIFSLIRRGVLADQAYWADKGRCVAAW